MLAKRLFSSHPNSLGVIPDYISANDTKISSLNEFIKKSKNLLVITGAGVSTESGIRDYRSIKTGLYYRKTKPMCTFQDFIKSELNRKKYWLRNFISFPKYVSSYPNSTHATFAEWEDRGILNYMITQNIDRLHQRAGTQKVLELHGTLFDVICISCAEVTARKIIQEKLRCLNSDWIGEFKPTIHTEYDGDVVLSDAVISQFKIPTCGSCGGILKTDTVFYGEDIPHWIMSAASCIVDQSDSLLVVGSSLHVYSCYQYIVQAKDGGKKIAIVNIGPTRADHLCDLKVNSSCGDVIPRLQVG